MKVPKALQSLKKSLFAKSMNRSNRKVLLAWKFMLCKVRMTSIPFLLDFQVVSSWRLEYDWKVGISLQESRCTWKGLKRLGYAFTDLVHFQNNTVFPLIICAHLRVHYSRANIIKGIENFFLFIEVTKPLGTTFFRFTLLFLAQRDMLHLDAWAVKRFCGCVAYFIRGIWYFFWNFALLTLLEGIRGSCKSI